MEMRRKQSVSLAETWNQIRTRGQEQKEGTLYKGHKNGLCVEPSLLGDEEGVPPGLFSGIPKHAISGLYLFACQLSLPAGVRLQASTDWGVSNMGLKRGTLVIKQVSLGKNSRNFHQGLAAVCLALC